MTVLAVDTTSEFGSVALRRAGQALAEVHLHATDGFGPLIIQAIQDVLNQAQMQLTDVDCFAGAGGPGSFSGVRVALSSIKGLAEVMHKPAAGISNLRALSRSGHTTLRAVALDARRNQVYGAVYNVNAEIVAEERVETWDEFIARIPAGVELVGVADGPCQIAGVPFTVASKHLAGAIAECAEMDGPGRWLDPVALDANYVRRSDAQMFWKDV